MQDKGEERKVSLVEQDKEELKKSLVLRQTDNGQMWRIKLKLSNDPGLNWEKIFRKLVQESDLDNKKSINQMRDFVIVDFSGPDGLERKIEELKGLIDSANEVYMEERKMKEQESERKRLEVQEKRLEVENKIDEMDL